MLSLRVVNYLQIKDVEKLIKNKQYKKLIKLSKDEQRTYFVTTNFAFWVNLSHALRETASLTSIEKELNLVKEKMTMCENYSTDDAITWHLLNADYWLKLSKYELAIKQLEEIDNIAIVDIDHSLYATKNLLEGIANYHLGNLKYSMENLRQVSLGCKNNCTAYNQQDCQSKAKLYWLKIFVKLDNDTNERQKLAREISGGDYLIDGYDWGYKGELKHYDGDGNITYRRRAKLINTGIIGNSLDDLIQKLISSF